MALGDLESEPASGRGVRRAARPPRARRRASRAGAAISRAGCSARAGSSSTLSPELELVSRARRVRRATSGADPARWPRGTRRGGGGAPEEVRAEAGRAGGKDPPRPADGGARVEPGHPARPPGRASRSARTVLGASSAARAVRRATTPGPGHHRGARRGTGHEGGAGRLARPGDGGEPPAGLRRLEAELKAETEAVAAKIRPRPRAARDASR